MNPPLVINKGKTPEKIEEKGKGKANIDMVFEKNRCLRKEMKKLQRLLRIEQSKGSCESSGMNQNSKQSVPETVTGPTTDDITEVFTAQDAPADNEQTTTTATTTKDANGDRLENNTENKKQSSGLDMTNSENWIMVVYGDKSDPEEPSEYPMMSKEDVRAVMQMIENEQNELDVDCTKTDDGGVFPQLSMPSFDLGICTLEAQKPVDDKNSKIFEDAEILTSGPIQRKPPRRRLKPVRLIQDHVLLKNKKWRRSFKDPKKWEDVRRSILGEKREK